MKIHECDRSVIDQIRLKNLGLVEIVTLSNIDLNVLNTIFYTLNLQIHFFNKRIKV